MYVCGHRHRDIEREREREREREAKHGNAYSEGAGQAKLKRCFTHSLTQSLSAGEYAHSFGGTGYSLT